MNNLSVRQYVGARYVPIFGGEWDKTKSYEPLVIVSYQGNSYTSKTFVPANMDIGNETFWALTGNYNAQVELYRQNVLTYTSRLEGLENNVKSNFVTPQMFGYNNGDDISNWILEMIELGNLKMYIPAGQYFCSVSIDENNIEICGAGINTTLVVPANATYCIKLDNTVNWLGLNTFKDFKIEGHINADGIFFDGESEHRSNDNNYFKNIEINHCKNGIHLNGRCIRNIFEDVRCRGSYEYGLYCNNELHFITNTIFTNCEFIESVKCGVYLHANILAIKFISCNIEANYNGVSFEKPTATAMYFKSGVNGVKGLSIDNCYIENNGYANGSAVSNSCALYFAGLEFVGVDISSNLIWGSEYFLYNTCKAVQTFSVISNYSSGKYYNISDLSVNHLGITFDALNKDNSYNHTYVNNSSAITPLTLTMGVYTEEQLKNKISTVLVTFNHITVPDMNDNVSVGRVIIFAPLGAGSFTLSKANGFNIKGEDTLTINGYDVIAFIGVNGVYNEIFRSVK